MIDFADIIGIIGVICVLSAYFALQASLITINDSFYSRINAVGSLMILYSLIFHWNTSSVVIEIFWFSISVYGEITRWIRKKA